MIIHGPATANYDVDLGVLTLQDWAHAPTSSLWDVAKLGGPPTLENTLLNGTNIYGTAGKKYETTFVAVSNNGISPNNREINSF